MDILPYGDAALLVRAGQDISPETNALVRKLLDAIDREGMDGITDLVPSYNELLVCYDPGRSSAEALEKSIRAIGSALEEKVLPPARVVEIPVRYGGSAGPDLEEVARHGGLRPEEVVRLHSTPDYLVYMLGFTPGFCYLGGMDPRIATPRRETPRLKVPAGSVGIAGGQTGVYPIDSPGGWQLIGQTDVRLFDPDREPPFLLRPGDRLRFVPVPGTDAGDAGDGGVAGKQIKDR